MEGIDLAGVVDSDFQGIQINFAPPRRFCQFSRGGARPAFCGAGWGSPFSAVRGWTQIPGIYSGNWNKRVPPDRTIFFNISIVS